MSQLPGRPDLDQLRRQAREPRHTFAAVEATTKMRLFRGAKLRLVGVAPALVEAAMRPGRRLVARITLTDCRGNPICARVHPPYLTWPDQPAQAR